MNYTDFSMLEYYEEGLLAEGSYANLSSKSWRFNKTYETSDYEQLMEGAAKARDTDLPFWVQAAWTTIFVLMIFIAVSGNCIVIWIVLAHRRMRTVTNYFLVNLSIADLLLSLFNCSFNSIYMIQRTWPFGNWYCTVSNFIANATVAASVFTLTGISCDRYLAIVYPLHPRMSKTSSLITIFFIWTASMIFAFPCLLYSATIIHRYQMLFLIITYIVPMTLMSLCYTIMGRVLWGSRSIGELTQRQVDSIRSKRKVVKMFILVVLIFGLCWLPYHSYFIYVYYDTKVIYSKYTQHVYLSFYWFAMSNAMVNPLIYYWMNARFRQYFKTAVCGWKRYFKRRYSHDMPPTPRNSLNSNSKSGAGEGSIKYVRSSPFYQNGNAHYPLLAGTNGLGRGHIRKLSNRTTRTTSLKKDVRNTTYL